MSSGPEPQRAAQPRAFVPPRYYCFTCKRFNQDIYCPECGRRVIVADDPPIQTTLERMDQQGRLLRSASRPFVEKLQDMMITIQLLVYNSPPEDQCRICRETLQLGQQGKQLPTCRHVFHSTCLSGWLTLRNTCPSCREEFPLDTLFNRWLRTRSIDPSTTNSSLDNPDNREESKPSDEEGGGGGGEGGGGEGSSGGGGGSDPCCWAGWNR